LTQILAEIPQTLDGEWVPASGTFFAFDLPDCPLDYDVRRRELAKVLGVATASKAVGTSLPTRDPHLRLVACCLADTFSDVYAGLKGDCAEGVVLKCRRARYAKQFRPGVESRDWIKRRFGWD
jgi:ATP-dependent DNA ligase